MPEDRKTLLYRNEARNVTYCKSEKRAITIKQH